ncbi:FeS assembly ATPase SufC [Pavlovales sp. CCMP2436]|nr:FeS assembly ATPase SufC [Pavlovales sp. CCMP2436]|mmetsp:Transcript_26131/g.66357  ORF Transcript_26131/g.66357 Transcript_26131/m.66357 type:complete len:303 (-) Transcript_26131:281-1189(-)
MATRGSHGSMRAFGLLLAMAAVQLDALAARAPIARATLRMGALRMGAGDVLLDVRNLQASVEDVSILKGVDLVVRKGEVHAIMGPNGSGKSTFSKVLVGHHAYTVTGGAATYDNQDLLGMDPEDRANKGLFMAFQYPVEVPGVTNADFLRVSLNEKRLSMGQEEVSPLEFFSIISKKLKAVGMKSDFLNRNVNEGFSGGEKKRNEILQMVLLEPQVAILDELDSGLDIDALKEIAEGVNKFRSPDNAIVMITHYQRLLDYIKPDFVHIMSKGRIVKTGDASLALELEAQGYGWVTEPEVISK